MTVFPGPRSSIVSYVCYFETKNMDCDVEKWESFCLMIRIWKMFIYVRSLLQILTSLSSVFPTLVVGAWGGGAPLLTPLCPKFPFPTEIGRVFSFWVTPIVLLGGRFASFVRDCVLRVVGRPIITLEPSFLAKGRSNSKLKWQSEDLKLKWMRDINLFHKWVEKDSCLQAGK